MKTIKDLEQYRGKDGILQLAYINLTGANLEGANLYKANLEGANLTEANLEGANLKGAYLEGAYLRRAYLEGANLTEAYLRGANLYNIKGKDILTFSSGKHFAYCCDNIIKIGCKSLSIEEWLNQYKDIGKDNGYSDKEILSYGMFINLCKERFL